MTRRSLIQTLPAAGLALAAPGARPSLCLFSKHAAALNYSQLGDFAKKHGFDGIDLTVRPGGHVLPEKVQQDLPKAVEQIQGAGSSVPMITTGLTNPKAPECLATLRSAGELKIPFWKVGYFRYEMKDGAPPEIEKRLAEVQEALNGLTALSRQYGCTAGFHNHSGNYVGSPVWDTRQLLAKLSPQHVGYYFDPAHATAEGGLFGWQASLEIALTRLKMVAVKDFYWAKDKTGKWVMKWCPLGEGMVDWKKVLGRLAQAGFRGPVTLHVEYEGKDELEDLARDGAVLRKLVEAAYAGS